MKNLLILGAGQYGSVVHEIAVAMDCFEKIDFLDDNNPIAIGKLQDYVKFAGAYNAAIVAIGNPKIRLEYIEKLENAGYEIATLIHPKAYVSPSSTVDVGCVVEPLAGINANVVVGKGCLISMGAIVNHNAVINDGCHIDCGSVVVARRIAPRESKYEADGTLHNCAAGKLIDGSRRI